MARRLLARAVAADRDGASVLGDLDDEFVERAQRDGAARARRWYWRQAAGMWWWSAWTHPLHSYHQPRGDMWSGLILDIRHAARVAMKAPWQTALIAATLAAGIGASTIGFAFADTALIRGLPVADPERTVMVFGIEAREPDRRGGVYRADVRELRERVRTVEVLSTWAQGRATLLGAGPDAMRVTVSRVTGDLFGVWGITTALGRALTERDSAPGASPAAVVTNRFWRETLRGDPGVVGRSFIIDGRPTTVVGVLSEDIEIGTFANVAFWIADDPARSLERDTEQVMVTGRLAPGVAIDSASAEFDVIADALAREHPETNRGRQHQVVSARRAIGGPNFALVLALLLGAAGLVVIIASVNVAGVLLARAVVRQREFAMRVALGARHTRLYRQTIAEGLLLALLGAAGGVALAEGGLRVIRSVEAEPIFQQITIDGHELAFVAGVALLAPLFFSLAPAFSALRPNVAAVLSATSSRSGGHSGRARDVLVVAQLALAVALALVGGLVARTAMAIAWAPPGFDTAPLMSFTVAVQEHSPAATARREAMRMLTERLTAGGFAAGSIDIRPVAEMEVPVTVAPDGLVAADRADAATGYRVRVDANALPVLGVPLLAGRAFTTADVENGRRVAMVSRQAADRYYGGVDQSIGRRLGLPLASALEIYEVVGVTEDVANTETEEGLPPRVWLPLNDPRVVSVVVRAGSNRAAAAAAIRQAIREAMPGVPLEGLESYERSIARVQGGNRVAMGMLFGFVCVGLVFAMTGLYGAVALATNLRTTEFATRLALGATGADIVRLIAWHTARLVVLGVVPGLAAGLLIGHAIRGVLYGVTALDPANLGVVILVIAALAFAASLAPARRAVRTDVTETLRG